MLAHGQGNMTTPNTGTNIQAPIINPGLIGDEGYRGLFFLNLNYKDLLSIWEQMNFDLECPKIDETTDSVYGYLNVTEEAVTKSWIKPLEQIPHEVWESDSKETCAKHH